MLIEVKNRIIYNIQFKPTDTRKSDSQRQETKNKGNEQRTTTNMVD